MDSYKQERKSLAQTTIDWSVENANRLRAIFQSLLDGNNNAFYEGLKEQAKHINHVGLDIGFIYAENKEFDPNTYKSKAIVGMRAPHCWLSYNNQTISTIDLFEKNYVLLSGENCMLEKLKLPISERYPRTTFVISKDVPVLNQDFYSCYQITKI